MKYFIKYSKKDEYGVEKNIVLRSGRTALVDTLPIPFVGSVLESSSNLTRHHPVISAIAGQSGIAGAMDKNINRNKDKKYLRDAIIVTGVGGAASALPASILGKYLAENSSRYYAQNKKGNFLLDIAKTSPKSVLGKAVNNYIKHNTGSFMKILGKTALVTIPISLALAPLKYAIGYTFGKNLKPESYK